MESSVFFVPNPGQGTLFIPFIIYLCFGFYCSANFGPLKGSGHQLSSAVWLMLRGMLLHTIRVTIQGSYPSRDPRSSIINLAKGRFATSCSISGLVRI